MTADSATAETFVWALPVREPIHEEYIKRLPPLFYDETADMENTLLVIKMVASHNPLLEVYLYEHDDGLYSALLVDRGATRLCFSTNFVNLRVTDKPQRFEHVRGFKPRSIGELFNEAEIDGLTVVAEEYHRMMNGLANEFFPSV